MESWFCWKELKAKITSLAKKVTVILSGSEEPVLEVSPRAEGNCSAALKVHENRSKYCVL
jgi:hypothetical protein